MQGKDTQSPSLLDSLAILSVFCLRNTTHCTGEGKGKRQCEHIFIQFFAYFFASIRKGLYICGQESSKLNALWHAEGNIP